ncbi:hypothetical protein [Streptomyces sp. N50]|uniref:hypothetical protein n=1 Tax=Streptomyces sp. N50 TaxID=3081765 RepID=UPI0029620B7D|nr:hypothetical protein [Streptomyces sp. N50]WOX14960.1 hypothetical protein R2B38_41670 [Streptomyces sp. N50]
MYNPGIQVLVRATAAVSVMIAAAACGGHQDSATTGPSATASPDSSVYTAELEKSDLPWSGSPSPYDAVANLDGGRRVALHYLRGKGLVEQHYSPTAKAWTEPRVIYRTKTDACQGIHLRTKKGTVAAIADFGSYCYDGEPPTESVAAVGTSGLTEWSVDVTKDFDGWERATVSSDGQQVVFGRDTTLRWSRADGFERS